jgi:outer membrane beta-barrel protein
MENPQLTGRAAVLISWLIPAVAIAQGTLGLDLTSEGEKKEDSKKKAAEVSASADQPIAQPIATERDTTVEDRVKSVQRKVYLKKHRFELAPYVAISLNDAYYSKFGLAVMGAYYLSDTLALSARFTSMQVIATSDAPIAKSTFQSRIFPSYPQWSLMGDAEWSPIYGKISIFNSILHIDAYILGGLGVVRTQTSALPGRGPNPAGDIGFGMRFVAKDWLAFNVALIDTAYFDTPAGTTKGQLQNMLMLNAGVSLFIPFKSTGREAE